MRYYVENWDTGELIKIFSTDEERSEWLKDNIKYRYDPEYRSDSGYLEDGTKISIYEM